MNPIIIIEIINAAVAGPLALNIAWRRGTIMYKATIAIKLNKPDCLAVNFFFFERPKCLGKRLVVAKGQTFLQNPVLITSKAGATGIKTFQKSNIPVAGKNNKQEKITTPANQTIV